MLLFVFGGSGSGKSEYAEQRILEAGEMQRYYVATMEPFGEEGKKRIERITWNESISDRSKRAAWL